MVGTLYMKIRKYDVSLSGIIMDIYYSDKIIIWSAFVVKLIYFSLWKLAKEHKFRLPTISMHAVFIKIDFRFENVLKIWIKKKKKF